jgi:flavin-binding protein dodecin
MASDEARAARREKVARAYKDAVLDDDGPYSVTSVEIAYDRAWDAAIAVVLEEAASAVAYLRWQEVDPFDDRTLGAAVKAIRAMKGEN